MKRYLLLLLCACCMVCGGSTSVFAQQTAPDTMVYTNVDTEASFPDLEKYFKEHFVFPGGVKEDQSKGEVVAEFIIDTSGNTTDRKIIKPLHDNIDEACLQILKDMPAWQPAVKNGRKVRSLMRATISVKPEGITKVVAIVAKEEYVHEYAERLPSYENYTMYIAENLVYPKEAIDKGIEGMVILRFTVNKTGDVCNIQVLKGVGGGCTEAAIEVLQNMGKWEPGLIDGKPVNVRSTAQIRFQLSDGGKKDKKKKKERRRR